MVSGIRRAGGREETQGIAPRALIVCYAILMFDLSVARSRATVHIAIGRERAWPMRQWRTCHQGADHDHRCEGATPRIVTKRLTRENESYFCTGAGLSSPGRIPLGTLHRRQCAHVVATGTRNANLKNTQPSQVHDNSETSNDCAMWTFANINLVILTHRAMKTLTRHEDTGFIMRTHCTKV